MDVRRFVLSYYSNATEDFHINEITKPRGALTLHSHGYFQIYYIKTGRIVHHLESICAELSAGDVFIIPPNLPHYITPSADEVRFYSISFMPSFLVGIEEGNKFVKDFIHYLTTLAWENVPPRLTLEGEDALFADTLVLKMMREFSADKTGKESVIKSALGLLLSIFARAYLDENYESIRIRSEKEAVMHCVSYLKNHLSDEITLDEMARKTAMSKTSFCRAFRDVVGESFKRYLNKLRVENAARLIKGGESVSVAARLSGYSDASTFYRNFKRAFGVAPSEYKE